MGVHGQRDGAPPAAGDAGSFERLYDGHVDELLGFLARRTRDAQLAADLTAETFAAALAARRRGDPVTGPAGAELQRIALALLAAAQRRGFAERSARRRLGMERVELSAADAARIDALGRHRPAALWARGGAPGAAEVAAPSAPPDFATVLRRQLRDAAPPPPAPVAPGRRTAGALLAAALLAAAATVVAIVPRTGTARTAPGPRVVATLALADGLGRSATVAFGSVWLSATNDAAVLRVDPRTRRVVARIPVGTDVNLGAGAGAIWAVPRRPSRETARLVRIDPRTNRVVARIPIPSPGARYPLGGAQIVAGTRVWVVGAMGLLAVDPARNRPVRAVVLGGDFLVTDAMLRGDELWVSRADRSVTRFDAVTGHGLGRLRRPGPSGFAVADGRRFVEVGGRSVALADPVGGRTLWRTRVGTGINDAAIVRGRLLVEGENGARSRDAVWEIDRRTGRVAGSMTVPGFGVTALLRVGGDAWLVTADGHVIVVAP
jgi:DNA-directed RNA polymerase specialized sigma24 family protein